MPACPECDDEFDQITSLKLHIPPAHGWSLNDARKDYLKEKFAELDGHYVHLVTWVYESDGRADWTETGEKEVIAGKLERDRLSNAFYNERGEWMVQWLGGHGPVGGFWLHEPDPETDRLGLPSPTRRVIDVEPLSRVKVEIGDETVIREVTQ